MLTAEQGKAEHMQHRSEWLNIVAQLVAAGHDLNSAAEVAAQIIAAADERFPADVDD